VAAIEAVHGKLRDARGAQTASRIELMAFDRVMSISGRLVRRSIERPVGPGQAKEKTMRVMVFVKGSEGSDKAFVRTPETTAMLEAMGRFNDQLRDAGILLAADGLKPSSLGKRIAIDGPRRTVIDGPFAETKELIAGFWLWEVKDMDEAVAWGKRCPNPMPGPSEIEIRPLYEAADLL
jgi:hypothetical protein